MQRDTDELTYSDEPTDFVLARCVSASSLIPSMNALPIAPLTEAGRTTLSGRSSRNPSPSSE